MSDDTDDLMLATSDGMVTRFSAQDVRAMGRTASGVTGMNVARGAHIVSATVVLADVEADQVVVTIGTDGTAKQTALEEYLAKGRGAKGVTTGIEPTAFCGVAADVHVTAEPPDVLRRVALAEARRGNGGDPTGTTVTGPVVAEQLTQRWRQG